MTEENKKEEKLELKLKFSPQGKKTNPPKEQTVSAPATEPLPELVEVKVNAPAVSQPERKKDEKPADKVDMASKTIPHKSPAKTTEAEKNFRRHVFKCWFWLVIAPVLLVLLASLLTAAYLFYLIMVNPNHDKTVRTSLASIRTNGVNKELLKKVFVPKKKTEKDKYEHVIYDSRIHDEAAAPASPSRPVRGSSGYGGGGRNNPYNLSRQRERINNINSQHNDKFKQHEDGGRRKKK